MVAVVGGVYGRCGRGRSDRCRYGDDRCGRGRCSRCAGVCARSVGIEGKRTYSGGRDGARGMVCSDARRWHARRRRRRRFAVLPCAVAEDVDCQCVRVSPDDCGGLVPDVDQGNLPRLLTSGLSGSRARIGGLRGASEWRCVAVRRPRRVRHAARRGSGGQSSTTGIFDVRVRVIADDAQTSRFLTAPG